MNKCQKCCPRCKSTNIVEFEKSYKCVDCKSEFHITKQEIDDEDRLAIQELEGICNELERLDEDFSSKLIETEEEEERSK